MTKIYIHFIHIFAFLSFYTEGYAQVAVNADGSTPSPKAMLDVKSTSKGTHITRMTTPQRLSIAPTASDAGLMVFDLDKNRLYLFDGQNWLPLAVSNLNETPLTNRTADDAVDLDHFGVSVAISGDYAIVGAYNKIVGGNQLQGAAYIFYRTGSTWAQQAKLTAADGAYLDDFGYSVAISGDYAIVGAYYKTVGGNQSQGAAYIFYRTGSTWAQQAKLTAADGAYLDDFGYSVAISGDYAIVGAYGKDVGGNINQGAAYIFYRTGSTWAQQPRLTADDGVAADNFGVSVAISGDYAIVGASGKDVGGNVNQGVAYIFGRIGTSWVQVTKLIASNGAANDLFGSCVAISGNYAMIGARYKDQNQGAAYIFFLNSGTWTLQAYLIASDGATGDYFGNSVSISGDYAIVGAYYKNIGNNANQGAAYIFKKKDTSWTYRKKLTNTLSGGTDCKFGISVGITPNAYIVGEFDGVNPTTGSRTGAAHFGIIDF